MLKYTFGYLVFQKNSQLNEFVEGRWMIKL